MQAGGVRGGVPRGAHRELPFPASETSLAARATSRTALPGTPDAPQTFFAAPQTIHCCFAMRDGGPLSCRHGRAAPLRRKDSAMTELRTTSRWGRVPAWWLLHPDVDADCFCVLAALATYADEYGVCVPSQATLAQRLRRSRPWVNRVVAQLAAAGLLEKTGRSRGNGGTTSCLYRLCLTPDSMTPRTGTLLPPLPELLPRPAHAAPDPYVTEPMPHVDTPCQACDTSQPNLEQNNTPAPRTPATHDVDEEVSSDWQPSPAVMAEALRLCPNADLLAHTARFRARCRARGYRYRAGHLGDAWLAWLLEDHGAQPRRSGRGHASPGPYPTADGVARVPTSPAHRYAAWAAAADTLPAQATSSWS